MWFCLCSWIKSCTSEGHACKKETGAGVRRRLSRRVGSTGGGRDVFNTRYTVVSKIPHRTSHTQKYAVEMTQTNKEARPSAKTGDKHPVGCCGLLTNLRARLGVVMVSSALCQRLARSA